MQTRVIGHQSNLQSLRYTYVLFLLLLVFPCVLAFSSPLAIQTITVGVGRHDFVVKERTLALSAVLTLENEAYTLDIGYRNREPVQDISLYAHHSLAEGIGVVSYFHSSLGTADSILTDLVLGYEQVFTLRKASFTFGFGIQGSASCFPFLEKPLFNASPYLKAKLGYNCFDRCYLTLFSTTNTLFNYACQSISPIVGAELALQLSKEITVGGNFHVQLSDVSPEAVLITSKEVGVYGMYKPKK